MFRIFVGRSMRALIWSGGCKHDEDNQRTEGTILTDGEITAVGNEVISEPVCGLEGEDLHHDG